MPFQLARPILWFDVETTGLKPQENGIVQIAMIRMESDDPETSVHLETKVNPEMEIPSRATDIHGITDEDVKDAPTWADLSRDEAFIQMWRGADIGGYNAAKFDIPFAVEMFRQAGVSMPSELYSPATLVVDPYTIATCREKLPRNRLADVWEHYVQPEFGHQLPNAHDASADIEATVDVFMAQVDRYGWPEKGELKVFLDKAYAPYICAKKSLYKDAQGKLHLGWGKYKGNFLYHVIQSDVRYLLWLRRECPPSTAELIKRMIARVYGADQTEKMIIRDERGRG